MVVYIVVNVHGKAMVSPVLMAASRQSVGIYLLGIDVGTGGTRALILDEKGRVVSSATEDHRPFVSPQIGWAEQDPGDWWRACGDSRAPCTRTSQTAVATRFPALGYPAKCMEPFCSMSKTASFGPH